MPEDAVLDTPVDDVAVADVVDTAVDQVVDTTGNEVVVVDKDEVKGDGRVEPGWLKRLKTNGDPDYKDAKEKFYALRSLDEKLNGFDLDKTKSWLEERGGLESLTTSMQEMSSKAEALDNINQAITTGDQKIVDEWKTVAPEGLANAAPRILSAWAEIAPDAYNAAVYGALSQVIGQTQTQGLFSEAATTIPAFMAEVRGALWSATPEQKGQIASALLGRMEQLFGSFQTTAQSFSSKAPQPGQQRQSVPDERAKWEQERFTAELSTEENSIQATAVNQALAEFIARQPKREDLKADAIELTTTRLKARMDADKEFKKGYDAFIAQKNKAGALAFRKSREAIALKDIAPKVGNSIFGNTPAPVAQKPVAATRTASSAQKETTDPFKRIWHS